MATKVKLIETGAVTGNIIPDGGIATGKLANDAVTTIKISDANITHAKLHTSMDLTGKTVTVATAAGSTNTTAAASTAFVQQELTTLIGGAPSTLNDLNELAAAINDDSNYNSTLTTALATKLPLAGGTMTGSLTSNSLIKTTGAIEIASAQPRLLLDRGDGSYSWNIYNGDGTGNFPLSTFNIANNGGTAVITALDNGNVGIGNTAPTSNLTIGSSQADGLEFTYDSTNAYRNRIVNYWNSSTDTRMDFEIGPTGNVAPTAIMSVGYGGNVGIGTTTPYGKLQIEGNTNGWNVAPMLVFSSSATGQAAVRDWAIGPADTSYGYFHINQGASTGASPLATSNVRFTISDTGNVGIGTALPSSKLHVQTSHTQTDVTGANSNSTLNIANSGSGNGVYNAIKFAANQQDMYIMSFNNNQQADRRLGFFLGSVAGDATTDERLSILGNGNVGIGGTTAPLSPLDVQLHSSGGRRFLVNYDDSLITIKGSNANQNPESLRIVADTFRVYTGTSGSGTEHMSISNTGSVIVPGTLHSPGHVIQTVYATNSTLVVPSQTINDYTTFIQVNITPKYATSKILITGIAGVELSTGNYPTVHCRLYRDSTHIKSYLYWGYEGAQTTHRILNEPMHFLDSPTTTSALTYYAKLANSSGSSYTGTYQGKAHAYNPSTIIVQEIAQ